VNYSSWSIKTLRSIAEAFDLTLRVTFEGFGSCLMDVGNFNRKNLERLSFNDDPYFKENDENNEITPDSQQYQDSLEEETTCKVYYLEDHISRASSSHGINTTGLGVADRNVFNF